MDMTDTAGSGIFTKNRLAPTELLFDNLWLSADDAACILTLDAQN